MSEAQSQPIGIKFDAEKPDYSLIPPNALNDLAKVLTYGAAKYDRENWRKLDDLQNRYFAAAQRHMWAVRSGEPFDPETGIHHMAHAVASLMFILEAHHESLKHCNPKLTDDRRRALHDQCQRINIRDRSAID